MLKFDTSGIKILKNNNTNFQENGEKNIKEQYYEIKWEQNAMILDTVSILELSLFY